MRTVTYHNTEGKEIKVSYDEDAPCIVCGEPVISASMGGTAMCGSCDCGRCRYCGITIVVFKEEYDYGKSKRELLKHMKWHKEHNPDLVEKINSGQRLFMKMWDANHLEKNDKGYGTNES